jgi:hypothetical protein
MRREKVTWPARMYTCRCDVCSYDGIKCMIRNMPESYKLNDGKRLRVANSMMKHVCDWCT